MWLLFRLHCCVSFRLLCCCVITQTYNTAAALSLLRPQHSTVCSKTHSGSTGYSHCDLMLLFLVYCPNRFRKLTSLYFSLLKLILYSMQRLSIRKIITNTHSIYYNLPPLLYCISLTRQISISISLLFFQ